MKLAAAIFDLDGTILNNVDQWVGAYKKVAESLGKKIDGVDILHGESIKKIWETVISKHHLKTAKSLDELERLTYKEYAKLIPEITLKDGFIELTQGFKERGFEVGLATGCNWDVAEKILINLDLLDYFNSLTTGEEVQNKKPDPEIYLVAAEKLGIEPNYCLVFEDSEAGIKAAKEAGMKVVAIDSGNNSNLEKADFVVSGFPEVNLKMIDAI